MVEFKVKLGTSSGDVVVRRHRAPSAQAARAHFTEAGYFVFSVSRQLAALDWFGWRRKIPIRKFLLFNREFKGLIRAGLPVVESLDLLLRRMKDNPLRTPLASIREKVSQGEMLSEAFASLGRAIPSYYPALLYAGEQSGNLEEILDRFIHQEERLHRMRKKFRNALTYPVFLMIVGMIALYIILGRAMPQFAGFYEDSGQALPKITQTVILLSSWAEDYFFFFLITGILLVLLLIGLRGTNRGHKVLERMVWRIPILGPVVRQQNQNTFAWTMRMLLAGGIPLPESLKIAAEAMPSPNLQVQLQAVREAVERGATLEQALDEHGDLDPLVTEMVRIGESTGTLGDMFEYIALSGEERAEDMLEMISNVLAPVILLFVGLSIAALVLSMYLPMFGLADLVGGM